jgi:hypothetical protein
MNAEKYLIDRYGAYRGHYEWRALESAFNAGAIAEKPRNAIAQAIFDAAFSRKMELYFTEWAVVFAMQEPCEDWLFTTENVARTFLLIVAESLS